MQPHSLEHRAKISESRKGKYSGENNHNWTPKIHKRCDHCGGNMVTTAYRLKVGGGKCCSRECQSQSKIGKPSKKRTGENRLCMTCGKEFYATPGQIKKGYGLFCSVSCSKMGHVPWNKGAPCPKLAKENNPAWKGGTATEYELIKGSAEYKLWRLSVYRRDKYTCQACGATPDRKKGVSIHAHHIFSFAEFPHKRVDISNGITLCKSCHWKAHGRKENQ